MKIVFVHLGEARADHLWANINSLISRFQSFEIVLVSDKYHKELLIHPRVSFFLYTQTKNIKLLLTKLKFEENFRKGFWFLTLERLIAIGQYHQENPLESIIHVESDVLLLNEFPIHVFDKFDKLIWLRAHDSGDIATLVYSPNAKESHWLTLQVEELINHDNFLTDMKALKNIRELNPARVLTAPSLSLKITNDLIQKRLIDKYLITELSDLSEHFKGIFDPAAIGMWLTGCDPRNHYGFTRIFDTKEVLKSNPYVDPSLFEYTFSKSGVLAIRAHDVEVPIWCLHIHSKDLRFFNSGWESRLQELVKLSKSKKIRNQFDIVCFLKLVYSNYRNRTLIGFILYIPRFRRFREFLIRYKVKMSEFKR
jgi:hypothetical protein